MLEDTTTMSLTPSPRPRTPFPFPPIFLRSKRLRQSHQAQINNQKNLHLQQGARLAPSHKLK